MNQKQYKRNEKKNPYIKTLICYALLMGILITLSGCGKSETQSSLNLETNISKHLTYEHSLELSYAKNFAVHYYEGGAKLLMCSDGKRYLILPNDSEPGDTIVPDDLPKDIIVIRKPVENVYLVASAAMDMIDALSVVDKVDFSGQESDKWDITSAREAMEQGKLLYAGKYSAPDYELIVKHGCSLAIENMMIYHTPQVIEKLNQFQIPVMVDLASYEDHPLGRVEWIKFYGALFDQDELAKQKFEEQRSSYEAVEQQEKTGKSVAFFYITSNGAVNIRKPSDYIPKMIESAGGTYALSSISYEENRASSMSIQMEAFYEYAKDADILIYNGTVDGGVGSIDDLLDKSSVLKDFKAVKNGQVWCASNDIYQHSMSVGEMTNELYQVINDNRDEAYRYFTYLQ